MLGGRWKLLGPKEQTGQGVGIILMFRGKCWQEASR